MTNHHSPDPEPILDLWRLWQEAQRLSNRTITERASTIRNLLATYELEPLEISPEAIIRFCGRAELKPNAAATYHAIIRAYSKWLVQTEQRIDDPTAKTPRPKRVRTAARPITDANLSDLLAVVTRRRTRMMILLAAAGGLREHEIAKFHGADLDQDTGVLVITGKGGSTQLVIAHERIMAEAANFPRDDYWFPPYGAQRSKLAHVSRSAVYDVMSRAMKRAGIVGTPHQLRHWFASSLLDEGVDVRIVQEMMRHKSITSTQIYTKVHLRQMAAAIALLRVPQAA